MGKNMIGIDMGRDRLKIVLVNGYTVKKSVIADMPDHLMKQGQITSVDAMAQLIRNTLRNAGIHGKQAAVVLSDEVVFVRNVTMPVMTAKQLIVNLPYECRDYVTGDLNNYVFDYAMLTGEEELRSRYETAPSEQPEDRETERSMELLAVAIQKATLDNVRATLRKAGLKLENAAPAVCVYANMIRKSGSKNREHCLLDLGYDAIRMYMFRGDCHSATRELEFGLSSLDEIIAEAYSVDLHQAHSYLLTNYEDCQNHEACRNFYNHAAVELMRAVNFYQFSNPDTNLDNVFALGGGTNLKPLVEAIRQMLPIPVSFARNLIDGKEQIQDCDSVIQAVGAALN